VLGSELLMATVTIVKFHAPFSAQPIDAIGSYRQPPPAVFGVLSLLLVCGYEPHSGSAKRYHTADALFVAEGFHGFYS
jgi:hypothetical protein